MSKKNRKERSAGFIIVTKIGGSFRVLGLHLHGRIDLPKGHIERRENDLEAAKRECKEESNIQVEDGDMKWGKESFIVSRPHKDVILFLAETTQEPMILQNPHTGIYEHESFSWLTWRDMKAKCYSYLLPAIDWAQSKIDGL